MMCVCLSVCLCVTLRPNPEKLRNWFRSFTSSKPQQTSCFHRFLKNSSCFKDFCPKGYCVAKYRLGQGKKCVNRVRPSVCVCCGIGEKQRQGGFGFGFGFAARGAEKASLSAKRIQKWIWIRIWIRIKLTRGLEKP